MEVVAHTVLLGAEIAFVVGIRRDFHWLIAHDFQAKAFEPYALDGIVRDEPHFRHAQIMKNVCADTVVALVGFEAEAKISFDGVHSAFLEFVSAHFVHQADAATFLV